jgi:hypothetical protein
LNKPEEGRLILKGIRFKLEQLRGSSSKMELADILLFEEKFNQALIYYSQIEMDLKNDTVAHEATLKAAKQAISKPILIGH